MDNLRILAENLNQKNEIIGMFSELGCKKESCYSNDNDDLMGIHLYEDGYIQDVIDEDYDDKNHKEITLPELRDLVVLKRNDVCDATHDCGKGYERFGYLTSDGVEYIWSWGNSSWFKPKEMNFKSLNIKPIEKKMKEYLTEMQDGSYKLIPSKMGDDDIEVPEGANIYAEPKDGIRTFWGNDYQWFDGCVVRDIELEDSEYTFNEWAIDWDAKILWQRYNQPEELPFIDDEPSINDQYAEIKEVRQATTETEYLMQGKNGEKLMESLAQFNNTERGVEFDSFELLEDSVNHPSHYTGHPSGIECIEITRHHGFAIGNAIKYLWRAGLKNSDNEVQDLEKAVWYIQDKIKQLKKVNENSSED